MSEVEVPQWKKELIARLQSRRHHQQLSTASSVVPPMVQQPSVVTTSQKPVAVRSREGSDVSRRCGEVVVVAQQQQLSETSTTGKMVMERMWEWDTLGMGGPLGDVLNGTPCSKGVPSSSDSDSSEDLHYGPGIVNKLRNKYLSLALRESANRASILPIRKAASMENILDEADSPRTCYQPNKCGDGKHNKNLPSRYRSVNRNCDMKRARSVETISRTMEEVKPKRESMHEEMLITTNGSEPPPPPKEPTTTTKPYTQRVNRPKRIQPLMNEREKPPLDVVKQARLIFERHHPEQRTRPPHHTGDVATKVANYKSIISKPPLKTKPKIAKARNKDREMVGDAIRPKEDTNNKKPPSPIPDVSRTNGAKTAPPSLLLLSSDTPDLIMTSSPKASVTTSPTYRISATENFIREEVKFNSKQPQDSSPKVPTTQPLRLEILNGDAAVINTKRRAVVDQGPLKIRSPLMSPALMSPLKSPPALPLRPMSPLRSPLKSPSSSMPPPPKSPVSPPPRSAALKSPMSPPPPAPHQTTTPKMAPAPLLVKSTSLPPPPPPPTVKALSPPPPKTPPPPLPAARSSVVESLPNVNKNASSSSSSATTSSSMSSSSNNNKPNLTILEIEKNLINTAKTMETLKNNKDKTMMAPVSPPILPPRNGSPAIVAAAAATNGVLVIKSQAISETTTCSSSPSISEAMILPKLPRVKINNKQEPDMNNTMVFNFTDRKDVPDYVQNDGITRAAAKIERPKVGEGGITLLPGASIDESTTDEDDEILRSLEAPPSPCDVTFINDNILIDGKSSLSQKTKKLKMRISFVEAGPEVFIYPSESSLIIEEATTTTASPTNNAQMGHTVPSLAGSSSLATYTPKGTGEDFQPGVTRSNIPLTSKPECAPSLGVAAQSATSTLEEVEAPVLFSAGTNSDILF